MSLQDLINSEVLLQKDNSLVGRVLDVYDGTGRSAHYHACLEKFGSTHCIVSFPAQNVCCLKGRTENNRDLASVLSGIIVGSLCTLKRFNA